MAENDKADDKKPASATKPVEQSKPTDQAKADASGGSSKKKDDAKHPAPEPSQDELDDIRSRAMTGTAAGGYKTR